MSLPAIRKTLPAVSPRIDTLSEVLRTVRLTGATFFSAEFRAPWGFTSPPIGALASAVPDRDGHLVLYHVVLEGDAVARVDGEPDVHLGPGDVIAFPHGHAHRVWSGRTTRWLDTTPAVRRALSGELEVTRGGGTGARTRFVCGYFSCEPQAEQLFLAGLPPIVTVSLRDGGERNWLEDAIRFLAVEAASSQPGRLALLTKLSEALFVDTLRRWMAAMPDDQRGWLAGARDAITGRALALLHRDPARHWSVDHLAREAGTSRSTLVERFTRFLNEAPMSYLARWRLRLGARLLETTGQGVIEIAAAVGYESEAAFNRAFRREYGLPPGRYRRQHAATEGVLTKP